MKQNCYCLLFMSYLTVWTDYEQLLVLNTLNEFGNTGCLVVSLSAQFKIYPILCFRDN